MAISSTQRLSADFWKFWLGQLVSVLGSSFTQFAIPLLVFKLTGSAVNLAIAMAASFLPYLLFGLIIGAWVDRLPRKQLMIVVNVAMGLVVASITLMAAIGHLSVWWIYGCTFVESTLAIAFNAAEFAAIPSLVGQDDLVTANGRIQAGYNTAQIAGPLLAGVLVAFIPLASLMLIDATSFAIGAGALLLVGVGFNAGPERMKSSIRQDVTEGLRYVLNHPVLRNISAMMAMVNFLATTTFAELVFFAKDRLHATNSEIGLLFACGSAGVVVTSLAAGRLRQRWSFSRVALGALMAEGLIIVAFAFTTWLWLALPLWALQSGVGVLFNINTGSLRQSIVPNHLLGRVMTIAAVLAWSAIPLGALLGGFAIQATHNVALVYAVIGILTTAIPIGFSFTALGHAEDYIPKEPVTEEAGVPEAARVS